MVKYIILCSYCIHFLYEFIQGDQKVSVHLMYCNRQVHRDFLFTLYFPYINNFLSLNKGFME